MIDRMTCAFSACYVVDKFCYWKGREREREKIENDTTCEREKSIFITCPIRGLYSTSIVMVT